MSSIADARAAIYSRLASSPTFHPASANLFENWTLQGGDVVTVKSDNDSYNLPIYGMKVKWNGATKVTVQSTGNEQREPLEKMAAKENERNNYRNRVGTSKNLQEIHYDIFDESGHFHSTLDMTASYLRTAFEDADNGLRSELEMTASYLRTSFEDADNGLRSLVEQTASSWRASVQGVVDSNGNITAASIAIAINDSGSSAYISADHIYLTGTVTLNETMEVQSNLLVVKKQAIFQSHLYVYNHNLDVGNMVNLEYALISASVSNNTLTIKNCQGDTVATFSKATTLSPSWSSGNFPLTVNAKQTNENAQGVPVDTTVATYSVGIGGQYGDHDVELELTTNGGASKSSDTSISVPLKIQQLASGGGQPTTRYTQNLTVGISSLLEAKTGSSKITSNGTYTPGSGKIGFSSVFVDVAGSTIADDDIQIHNYGSLSTGTLARNMKAAILQAIGSGTYFSFEVYVDGTSAKKTYYMDFGS